jgi:7-cyano-7-deazaguanine synthase
MSIVTLVSGGLDSTLMSLMAHEEGVVLAPLFIDYGQLGSAREWTACKLLHERHGLPLVTQMDVSGFGKVVPSGITNTAMRINEDAFLPGRNLLLLLCGAAYAYSIRADGVAIGLLNPENRLFPDQSANFLRKTEDMIEAAMKKRIAVLAPLIALTKADVIALAKTRGLRDTYSCHAGGDEPCGKCVACIEIAKATERS